MHDPSLVIKITNEYVFETLDFTQKEKVYIA